MLRHLRPAIVLLALFTLLTGIVYPLAVWGVGQAVFPAEANGSLVTRNGVVINTFMLDDSPSLRAFVERMTRINRGRALFTRPDRLGEYLLVDYLAKKRKRV